MSVLAFLPLNEVEEASSFLLRNDDFPSESMPIIRYFIRSYICTKPNNGVDNLLPLLPVELWNVNERTKKTTVSEQTITMRVGTESLNM